MRSDPALSEAILAALRVGVIATDEDGRAQLQNGEASRILGVSPESMEGERLERVLGIDHPAVEVMREALASRRPVTRYACELLQFPIGRPLVVDLAATPIAPDGGNRHEREADPSVPDEGTVITLTDRTIGRELEALAQQQERADEFGQLAAGIAHEIRNPLGGIRGAAQLLAQKLSDPDLGRYPQLITDEVDRLRRLLDDLAQLTRGEDLHPRPSNLHRLLDDVLELHSSDPEWSEVRLIREYDPSIPEVEVDSDRVSQVMLNLVRNAVQALSGKGTVTVRTRVEAPVRLSHGREQQSGVVHLEIQDDGPGIPAEDLPHIFTPFFTRSEQGTGLGLALAQHWTVRHGGRIRATSELGVGTRVQVSLPLRREPES